MRLPQELWEAAVTAHPALASVVLGCPLIASHGFAEAGTQGSELDETGAEVLMHRLGSVPQLSRLVFVDTCMPEGCAKALAVSLRQLTRLEELSLRGNPDISTQALISLVDSLCQTGRLRSLDLVGVGIEGDGAAAVAALIRSVTSLRRIVVGGSEFNLEGAVVLLEAMPEDDPLRFADFAQVLRSRIKRASRS